MKPERRPVEAEAAPAAIGPYSHAVRANGLLFCSGQIPLDPDSGELSGGTAAEQCAQCLRNLAAVCEAAGASLADSVRLTVYTIELERFAEINDAYGEFFRDVTPPARAVIGVSALPKGALIEIDAVVVVPG